MSTPSTTTTTATIAALKQVLDPLRDAARAAEEQARAAYDEARVHTARLDLAARILDADLPSGSVVAVMEWADEPNGDGTYDLDLDDAYDAEGTLLGNPGGQGAIPAGFSDGGTAWDIFHTDDSTDVEAYVDVNLVHAWLADLRS